MNESEEERNRASFVCVNNCIYMAPLSDEKGKVWCARKGKYVNALIINVMGGLRCDDYRERD